MAAVLHNTGSPAHRSASGRSEGTASWASGPRARRNRLISVAAIAALHVGGLYALMQIPEVRESVTEAAPVFVQFMMAPAPKPTPKPVEPEKPVVKPALRPVEQPKVLAATTTAPSTDVAPAPQPVPEPPPPPAPAPAAEAPPAPIIPPNFVAAYLDNPAPAYPEASARRGEAGKVMLNVHVGVDGRADDVRVGTTSGYERLDRAAIDAVKRWRFAPAKQGERTMAAWVQVPVDFNFKK
ncbi:hypothetical protein BH09PSE6_BH09PSE6_16140 [soil metagenome]